jgi:hypothetical protein
MSCVISYSVLFSFGLKTQNKLSDVFPMFILPNGTCCTKQKKVPTFILLHHGSETSDLKFEENHLLHKILGKVRLNRVHNLHNKRQIHRYTSGPVDPISSKVSKSQNLTVLSAEPE